MTAATRYIAEDGDNTPLRPHRRQNRKRWQIKGNKLVALETEFKKSRYPTAEDRAHIARKIKTTARSGQIWLNKYDDTPIPYLD